MRNPPRELHRLAGADVDPPARDLRREGAGCHQPFFIFEVMNVQRRARSMSQN